MPLLRGANLGVRFLLEVAALAAMGYWGFQAGETAFARILLGIGAPLVLAVLWGTFAAPRSLLLVVGAPKTLLGLFLLGAAALALAVAGQPALALAFGALILVNQALLLIW